MFTFILLKDKLNLRYCRSLTRLLKMLLRLLTMCKSNDQLHNSALWSMEETAVALFAVWKYERKKRNKEFRKIWPVVVVMLLYDQFSASGISLWKILCRFSRTTCLNLLIYRLRRESQAVPVLTKIRCRYTACTPNLGNRKRVGGIITQPVYPLKTTSGAHWKWVLVGLRGGMGACKKRKSLFLAGNQNPISLSA